MNPRLLLLALAALLSVGSASAEAPPVARAGGLSLGALALHSGSGEHPLAPQLGGWVRLPLGAACYLEPELGLGGRSEGGNVARLHRRYVRAALGLGCSAGTRATRVALSVGPAMSYRHTTIDALYEQGYTAASLAPGLRYRAGFLIPLGERVQLDILAGGSTHGLVFDHDLLLQGGVRW
jgi:hypothetical protein